MDHLTPPPLPEKKPRVCGILIHCLLEHRWPFYGDTCALNVLDPPYSALLPTWPLGLFKAGHAPPASTGVSNLHGPAITPSPATWRSSTPTYAADMGSRPFPPRWASSGVGGEVGWFSLLANVHPRPPTNLSPLRIAQRSTCLAGCGWQRCWPAPSSGPALGIPWVVPPLGAPTAGTYPFP